MGPVGQALQQIDQNRGIGVKDLKALLRSGLGVRNRAVGRYNDDDELDLERLDTAGYYESMQSERFTPQLVSNFMLPGHETRGRESCGQVRMMGCLENHHAKYSDGCVYCKLVTISCHNRGCSKCLVNTCHREAMRVTDRVMAFLALKGSDLVDVRRRRMVQHVAVSLPESVYDAYMQGRKSRASIRQYVKKTLLGHPLFKKTNIDGFVMFDHPYRFTDGLQGAKFAPHFHLVMSGWLDGQEVAAVYRDTGLFIKSFGVLESKDDIFRVSAYLLSHTVKFMPECGSRGIEHAVRYFGELGNRKFATSAVLSESSEKKDDMLKEFGPYRSLTVARGGAKYELDLVGLSLRVVHVGDSVKDVTPLGSGSFVSVDDMIKYVCGIGGGAAVAVGAAGASGAAAAVTVDNPALPQSNHIVMPPEGDTWVLAKFSYRGSVGGSGSEWGGLRSVYSPSKLVAIRLNPDTDCLCPEDRRRLREVVPEFHLTDDDAAYFDSNYGRVVAGMVFCVRDTRFMGAMVYSNFMDDDGSWRRNTPGHYWRRTGVDWVVPDDPGGDSWPVSFETGLVAAQELHVHNPPERLGELNPVLQDAVRDNIRFETLRLHYLYGGERPSLLDRDIIFKHLDTTGDALAVCGEAPLQDRIDDVLRTSRVKYPAVMGDELDARLQYVPADFNVELVRDLSRSLGDGWVAFRRQVEIVIDSCDRDGSFARAVELRDAAVSDSVARSDDGLGARVYWAKCKCVYCEGVRDGAKKEHVDSILETADPRPAVVLRRLDFPRGLSVMVRRYVAQRILTYMVARG